MEINQLLEKFNGKKVFITGHTGFKGSWLLMILNNCGATIKGYSLEPKQNDLYNLINGDKLCESVISDIRNLKRLKKEIIEFQPDYIFHLAAQPLVIESYKNPLYTFDTNFNGTLNLLEICREIDFNISLTIITTDKVYKNLNTNKPYKEEFVLGGHDPYSSSKAIVELLLQSYNDSFFNLTTKSNFISISSARSGNVIGGGDFSKDRIIPDMIKAFKNNDTLLIRNPDSIRPWQHVLDPLFGYILLAYKNYNNNNKFNTSYNFGPYENDSFTVKDLVIQSQQILNDLKYKIELSNNFKETKILKLDINKSISELKWNPIWNTKKSIIKTIEWYKYSKGNELNFSLDQIKQYINDF